MKKLLLFAFIFSACSSSEKEESLSTKTITIEQVLDNNVAILRPVIIQTPNVIDKSKNYPIVFAFHGRGGNLSLIHISEPTRR